jgi:hypothetical protein
MVRSGRDSARRYHLLPHERWATSHADRFISRKAATTPERLEHAFGPTAFPLFIASRVNLRVVQAIGLTIAVIAAVMVIMINVSGGPISTDQHPRLVASVVAAIVFWSLVLVGVFSLALFSVRTTQWRREVQPFAG